MHLTDDTAEIPDRLIALQEKGEIVFLCGAGISQRYGLPSFYKLTTDIYTHLGESWYGHPAEEDAMGVNHDGTAKGSPALDRALFALTKRLRGDDTGSRLRAEALLTEAIEAHLQPPPGTFPAHQDVWTLSRDPEMRGRIVTTNFDVLFERVGAQGVASRACADLPPPLATDFTGVLHLHGRIADAQLGLSRTQLVLNSAEFGEAYLRSGWAARYVYDLARATTIVILGYGADDPPMRYILEVLTADRERYPDIREIFAFVPAMPDPMVRGRIADIWAAKGATAILYDSRDPADHDALYRTISRWATFASNPTGWRRTEATRILEQDPEQIGEGDWERLHWLLGGGDAGELLGEINPDPKWAEPLAKANLFRLGAVSPFRWILARLNDGAMPAAVAEHVPMSQETIAGLERALGWRSPKTPDVPAAVLQAWRLIIQVASRRLSTSTNNGLRWSRVMAAIEAGNFSLVTKRDILACLRPRVQIGKVFRWPGLEDEPEADALALRHVLRVDWGPGPIDKLDKLAASWPADRRRDLIRALSRELDNALEEAEDTGTLHAASGDVKSIGRHSQDAHGDGFYPIVRALADLWDAEVESDLASAKSQAVEWLVSPYLLVQRLGLYALQKPLFSGAEVARYLLALDDADFWLGDSRRETMQLFSQRWPSLADDERAKVENRISSGLPRGLLIPDGDPEQIAMVQDNAVFIRLSRIEGTGQTLSANARTALEALRARHPNWRSEGERDDFRVWSSGARILGNQGDISLLAGTPPDRLLDRVEEVVGGDPFAQGDLWRLYCDAEPATALAALLSSDPTSTKRAGAWQSYFWSITAAEPVDIQERTLHAITADWFEFEPFTAISDWLLRKRPALDIGPRDLLRLWDRLCDAVERHAGPVEAQSRSDVVFSMLNSPEGKIGTLLLDEYGRVRSPEGRSDQLQILARLERLIGAEGELGFLGTAAAMDGLPALFSEHEQWADEHLLPLVQWTNPFAPAAWSVLLRQHIPYPLLYAALKSALFDAGARPDLDRSIDAVAGWMLSPLLWAQDPKGPVPHVEPVEVRGALARARAEVRGSAAYWLVGALEKLPGDRADIWRTRVGPLFRAVWPLEPRCRSSGATLHLVRLALLTGFAFADAVGAIAPALGPLETWEVESYLGRDEDARRYYDTDPGALLTLFDAVVSEENVPSSMVAMLERLVQAEPALTEDGRYLKLLGWARRRAAPS